MLPILQDSKAFKAQGKPPLYLKCPAALRRASSRRLFLTDAVLRSAAAKTGPVKPKMPRREL